MLECSAGSFKCELSMSCQCVLLTRGIPTVPGTVSLKKDGNNLIGISIGGGAQYCPCLYIVQVCAKQLMLTATKCFFIMF